MALEVLLGNGTTFEAHTVSDQHGGGLLVWFSDPFPPAGELQSSTYRHPELVLAPGAWLAYRVT